jgi:hypothetical protein
MRWAHQRQRALCTKKSSRRCAFACWPSAWSMAMSSSFNTAVTMTNGRDKYQAPTQLRVRKGRTTGTQRDIAGHSERQWYRNASRKSSHQAVRRHLRPSAAVGNTPSVRILRANQYELRNLLTRSWLSVGDEEFPYCPIEPGCWHTIKAAVVAYEVRSRRPPPIGSASCFACSVTFGSACCIDVTHHQGWAQILP